MKKNILKIELFLLFTVTLFSFSTFYFGDTLPDNVFTITSDNSINFVSYYFFSVITFTSYVTGPWTVVSFFIFSLALPFIYDRREYFVDCLNVFTLLFATAGTFHFIVPEMLGEGLQFVFNEFFNQVWLAVYVVASYVLFLFGTFRSSFKEYVISFLMAIKNMPSVISNRYSKFKGIFTKNKDVIPSQVNMKKRVETMLKSENTFERKVAEGKESFKDKLKGSVPLFVKKENSTSEEDDKDTKLDNLFEDNSVVKIATGSSSTEGLVVEESVDYHEMTPNQQRAVSKRPLNAVADGTQDNSYFNIVEQMGESKTEKISNEPDSEYFEQIIGLLETKLSEFKIEGKIVNVLKGPVVDTFELELGTGVKVSKVTGASEDLSLALFGIPIRIVYPMKGRTTVGIEVPRNPREIIYLDEVLNSSEFQKSTYALPIAMGKDAFGDTFVIDLASCPHMLVAGATGAGKSVFINSLLVSLLVKKSPKKMKLILIDPKQLELALYAKLPHLVMPVVTDAKTASIALLWAAQEMDRRYSILKEFGVRNIAGFNEKLKKATPEMLANIHQYYEDQGAEDYELPYMVVIVDEFADLILTKAGKEIEQNIARLAAKARAAGIHLILATQRPSVDVITGVIKSNFPTRVSFRVTSSTDSRTILDKIGAERLLGKGDMLYKAGISTQRVHSSYVDEEEIEALTKKLEEIPKGFNENAMEFLENGGEVETDEYSYGSHVAVPDKSGDAMYNEALKVVMEGRSASASMLQRRLRIGYNRAANLIEEMERRGVVGPAQGSKPRKVLMSGDSPSL